MKILFVDMAAQKPYTANTLRSYAMGGSEASVIRVAGGLAKEGHLVFMFQGCDPYRTELSIDGIFHCNELTQFGEPDVVVHLRTAVFVETFKELYPNARHIVWLHDIVGEPEPEMARQELVCVSQWHSDQVSRALTDSGDDLDAGPLVTTIYNPVVVGEAKRQEKVKGRLGFFSSPHKGLSQVLEAFLAARAVNSALELVVADPGYLKGHAFTAQAGIINLGQLPHHRVLEEMSKCEVLFQVQTVFPETFGLVLAEANAMGTPVLAHNFGAASEVLQGTYSNMHGNSVRDFTKPEEVAALLKHMLDTKPRVEADERFSLENVLKEWKELLGAK